MFGGWPNGRRCFLVKTHAAYRWLIVAGIQFTLVTLPDT